MTKITNCPNCKVELKNGIMTSTKLLTETQIGIINEYNDTKSEGYCTKCGNGLYDQHSQSLQTEKNNLTNYLKT